MPASDLNFYVQGFKFLNAPANWDSGNNRFLDLSGLGAHCDVTGGSPTFSNAPSGHEGWKMVGGVEGAALRPNGWHGSAVIVASPHNTSNGSTSLYGIGPGNSNDEGIWMRRYSSSQYRWGLFETQSVQRAYFDLATDATAVFAVAWDQQAEKWQITQDGVTVTDFAATFTTNSAILVPMMGNYEPGVKARVMRATSGILPWLHEAHFFAGNIITDQSAALQTYLTELATEYS